MRRMNRSRENYDDDDPSSKMRRMDLAPLDENACQMLINNSHNVLDTMRNLYREGIMCDVYLTVGDQVHGAHRLILCAFSDVFQAMLMTPEWTEWHESKVVLQELPQCEPVFHNFLEYLYTGKILITHTNVSGILCLADKYLVTSLTELCTNYMRKQVPHASSSNVLFSWLQYTATCGHKEVAEQCLNYVKWNLESVANTPEFGEFDGDLFVSLLQENDIVVHNEMVLYNLVLRWLDLQEIRLRQSGVERSELALQMENLVEDVMSNIRFPMMPPRDLADLLMSPLLKQYKEFFVERMAQAMIFHKGHTDKMRELYDTFEGRLQLTPRLYTSDSFGSILLVENFFTIPAYHANTFVFSSHMSAAEHDADRISEWMVDLYPRGVCFKQCYLIAWQGTLEVPERVIRTVRLSLTYRNDINENDIIKVRIGLLLFAKQNGKEHITQVTQKRHYFTAKDRVLNFEDFIPFEDLNPPCSSDISKRFVSRYLTGIKSDQIKINIVIIPECPNFDT